MLRRLHPDQPEGFAFTEANRAWAEAQITKYPEGREASAVIPLLWRAQEQEGWLSRAAIEHVADMLGMAYIRALEVASFYFMFQLQPVGSLAHFQICGTTSCMICGAEDLMQVCREKIAPRAHEVSPDGKFSWEEVECLGACANAPMAQIGKDYYEDLTPERFARIIDEIAAGDVPVPGPQNGRFASEPAPGRTSLQDFESGHARQNASVALAIELGDTIRRIDGSEVPLKAPWGDRGGRSHLPEATGTPAKPPEPAEARREAEPQRPMQTALADEPAKPEMREAPDGTPDDLTKISGIGPKLAAMLNEMGVYHFDQIAAWRAEEVAWMDDNLESFKGRVTRDDWVDQARALASDGETEKDRVPNQKKPDT